MRLLNLDVPVFSTTKKDLMHRRRLRDILGPVSRSPSFFPIGCTPMFSS